MYKLYIEKFSHNAVMLCVTDLIHLLQRQHSCDFITNGLLCALLAASHIFNKVTSNLMENSPQGESERPSALFKLLFRWSPGEMVQSAPEEHVLD